MDERDYPKGIDCVWIGADRNGRLGVFVTGGEGPIPALALRSDRTPVEDIESLLLQLPSSTSSRLVIPLKRPDDFMELAQRGFFAYDWSDIHRTRNEATGGYELIAVPEVPLVRGEVPSAIASLVEGLELNVDFAVAGEVDAGKEVQCRTPK